MSIDQQVIIGSAGLMFLGFVLRENGLGYLGTKLLFAGILGIVLVWVGLR